MTEKAVRQLRTNFEKLGARLGENLAGQSYPFMLLRIERLQQGTLLRPEMGPTRSSENGSTAQSHRADQGITHTEHSRDLGLVVS